MPDTDQGHGDWTATPGIPQGAGHPPGHGPLHPQPHTALCGGRPEPTASSWLLAPRGQRRAPEGAAQRTLTGARPTHLVHVQLLLELLLVFLQELLVLLLDDQVLQGLGVLGQRGRLRAPQRAVLPQLVDGGGHPVRADQGLRVQGQRAQA